MRNFAILLLIIIYGCGPSSTEQTTDSGDSTPTSQNFRSPKVNIPDGAVIGYEHNSFSYTHSSYETSDPAINYSVANLPWWASFNTATGEITGQAFYGLFKNIEITKNTAGGSESSGLINIFIHGDPLYVYSWHLSNTGQSAFSLSVGTSGEDLNMQTTISDGYDGQNIKVLISDTGSDFNHEDLVNNLSESTSKNYSSSSTPQDENGHGTAVTGIIAAEAMNNIGGRGVAPNTIVSIKNFLDSSTVQNTANLIDQANGNFDIFNFSYGDLSYMDRQTEQDYIDQLDYGVNNLRSGLGAIYVKSSGNEFYLGSYSIFDLDESDGCVNAAKFYECYENSELCLENFIFSHNANSPYDNEQPHFILTGALDADGKKAQYSNAGSNIWVSAPGGSFDMGAAGPAIITTDIAGCLAGFSKEMSVGEMLNYFEYNYSQNSVCNYTSTMNGTSAAAPMVSGAAAILLDVDPSLTWRDIKHILALTARQVDNANGNTEHPSNLFKGHTCFDLPGHTYEQGWVTNAAGYKFHNWYGFGAVDIDAAVAMAKSYAVNLGTYQSVQYSSSPGVTIPDYSATGVSDIINVPNALTVETIQVTVSITSGSADFSGEIGVEITSPSGTKSILKNINNSFLLGSDKNLSNYVLLSNAFYGESSSGNWTLKVIDGYNSSGTQSVLNNWKITVNGH